MADISEFGYDKFLNKVKVLDPSIPTPFTQQLPSDEFDYIVEDISANKIQSGVATSLNNQLSIDFDQGIISVKEGAITRAEIKKFLDDKVGLRVYNRDGTTAIDQTN